MAGSKKLVDKWNIANPGPEDHTAKQSCENGWRGKNGGKWGKGIRSIG